ncbi:uncharacterized protein LOC126322580 [Schistocerca gregaria]|uniref:uncharacterized protein LOC126322580 n=1 Tax=Schistocerca gregaria TaxID=7010 RepID=UPI00211DD3C1|nr:uncharacterized protein LOC126322580 [Schistocerca gregaria]
MFPCQRLVKRTISDAQIQKEINAKEVGKLRVSVLERWQDVELREKLLDIWHNISPSSVHALVNSHMMISIFRHFPSQVREGAKLATVCAPELLSQVDLNQTALHRTHPEFWIDLLCQSLENNADENNRMRQMYREMFKKKIKHYWFDIAMESYRSLFLLQAAELILDHAELILKSTSDPTNDSTLAQPSHFNASPYFQAGMQTQQEHLRIFSTEDWMRDFIPHMVGAMNGDQASTSTVKYKAEIEKNPVAQHYLGRLYSSGTSCLPKDIDRAIYWQKQSANAGYAVAQDDLGSYYFSQRDFSRAKKLFKQSARTGYIRGQLHLGDLYSKEFEFNSHNYKALIKSLNCYLAASTNMWYSNQEEWVASIARSRIDSLKTTILSQLHNFTVQPISGSHHSPLFSRRVKKTLVSTGKILLILFLSLLAGVFFIFIFL